MILHGDCIEQMKLMPDQSIDSIVTDPPYELGFMNKGWDSSGIAYNVEVWRECFRLLKPGGHLLSFGGTRTYHRMAVAIEDAGFEIRDQINYVYGSGFPKSLNIEKALEKMVVSNESGNNKRVHGKEKAEYELRLVRQSDIPQTKHAEKKQREVLQSGVPEQSLHGTMQGGRILQKGCRWRRTLHGRAALHTSGRRGITEV
jgi:hypothetical protein